MNTYLNSFINLNLINIDNLWFMANNAINKAK